MATEEQTTGAALQALYGPTAATRAGQRLTITNRVVSKLSFKCGKGGGGGAPTGTITYTIRSTSDDSVLATKAWGDAGDIVTGEWMEVTFDTATYANEEVFILLEFAGGDSSNYVTHYGANTDEKADEYYVRYLEGAYNNATTWDATYIYTYTAGVAPTVTTQSMSSIAATTATGNGNVTALGSEAPTQHGHCWNTTGTPTTSDNKTENGAKAATGAFTSSLTSLSSSTKYYVKAYATNGAGTSYGSEIIFTAGESQFPSEAITRVTNLIHRYNRKEGVYTLEMALGEVTSDFGLPEWLSRPQPSKAEERSTEEVVEESAQAAVDKAIRPPGVIPTRPEFWDVYPGEAYPYSPEEQARSAYIESIQGAPTDVTFKGLAARTGLSGKEIAKLGQEISDIRMGRTDLTIVESYARLAEISKILNRGR